MSNKGNKATEDLKIFQITNESTWQIGPKRGFLTPTKLVNSTFSTDTCKNEIYGAVRDEFGRGIIRKISLDSNLGMNPHDGICFDRRGSDDFDSDGTILGHVDFIENITRLFYIGFRQGASGSKFQAFSGLAESHDSGNTFQLTRQVFHPKFFPSFLAQDTDIIACHWNKLDTEGNGVALVSIGSGWLKIKGERFPRYSSHLITARKYEFQDLIASIPQNENLYRLGRPRFLALGKRNLAVATGGKEDGDYRPYFFEFVGNKFYSYPDFEFPVIPGSNEFCKTQVSYPEILSFPDTSRTVAVFNGDNMGIQGCLAVNWDDFPIE